MSQILHLPVFGVVKGYQKHHTQSPQHQLGKFALLVLLLIIKLYLQEYIHVYIKYIEARERLISANERQSWISMIKVYCLCMLGSGIPYNGKLSREKTFADFAVLELSTKVLRVYYEQI